MKATVDRAVFVAALARGKGIAGGKGMPALANVRLRVADGVLEVAATDLQTTFIAGLSATGTEPGTRLVNASLFHEVVRAMPAGEMVTVRLEDERLLVTTVGSAAMRVNSSEASGYPVLVDPSTFPLVDADGDALAVALRQVLPAVCRDESRPNLCAVNVATVNGRAVLTTTDGRRLHQATGPAWSLPTVLVPTRAANAIREFLAGGVRVGIDITPSPTTLVVQAAAGDTLVVRLMDATFPDVGAILRQHHADEATFSASEMAGAVRRVSTMADSDLRSIALAFTGTDRVVLTSGEADRARETVTVAGKHSAVTLRVNARMLSEVLAGAGDGASMRFGDALAPLHVVSPGFVGIVMPQRA